MLRAFWYIVRKAQSEAKFPATDDYFFTLIDSAGLNSIGALTMPLYWTIRFDRLHGQIVIDTLPRREGQNCSTR